MVALLLGLLHKVQSSRQILKESDSVPSKIEGEKTDRGTAKTGGGHAVSLYLDIKQAYEKNKKVSPVCNAIGIVQHSPIAPAPQREFAVYEGHGLAVTSENKLSSAPTVIRRQPVTFKGYSATGDAKAQWVKAIAEMNAIIKMKHYSSKTLKSYGHWVWKFQRFKKDTDPASLTTEDVKAFLSWLAVTCNVSASSQN